MIHQIRFLVVLTTHNNKYVNSEQVDLFSLDKSNKTRVIKGKGPPSTLRWMDVLPFLGKTISNSRDVKAPDFALSQVHR